MSTIKVNKIENTSTTAGGVAIDSSGHVQVDGLQMPSAGALFARNKIINGSMEVAQRGTSSTANGYVSLDRWYVNQSGGSTTFSQETFAAGSELDSLKNYAKLAVSTSSDYTSIRQRIEDVRTVPAGSITVSFWAKGTAPSGDLSVFFSQSFGSGGSTEVDGTPQTVTLTSTWQRFSLTFTVPSISGKTIGTGNSGQRWKTDHQMFLRARRGDFCLSLCAFRGVNRRIRSRGVEGWKPEPFPGFWVPERSFKPPASTCPGFGRGKLQFPGCT